jgi:hypothetical protein
LRKSNVRSLHRTGTNKTKEQIAWCCICVRFGTRFCLRGKKKTQIALVLAAFACDKGEEENRDTVSRSKEVADSVRLDPWRTGICPVCFG